MNGRPFDKLRANERSKTRRKRKALVSVSARNALDGEIAFRINDPHSVLPRPFPVFGSRTRFVEDEYI